MSKDQDMLISYVQEGNLKGVKALLSIGVDANTYYYDTSCYRDKYVAWIALMKNDLAILKILLEYGASVSHDFSINHQHYSMINYAIKQVNAGIATTELPLMIISHAKNVNDKAYEEDYPLVNAIKGQYNNVIDALLAKGANPNYGNPLATATGLTAYETIEKLLSHGVIPKGDDICAAIDNNEREIANLFAQQLTKQELRASDKKDVNFCLVKQPGFMELPHLTAIEAGKHLAENTKHYHDYQCHSAEDKAVSAFMNDYGYYELICASDSAAEATVGHEEL
jgi:hypothetical protein